MTGHEGSMISVVIPVLNVQATLGTTLAALVPAAVDGLVKELILVDGGSSDATLEIAEDAGARVIHAEKGRGVQLAAGCAAARSPWLMVLHADTRLARDWAQPVLDHLDGPDDCAGYFRFALDDRGWKPRLWEAGVALRCRILGLPYGDQGLLISRRLLDAVGGYRPLPLMEDVDLVRRIGARRLSPLDARATTSALRFRRDGYLRRSLGNWGLLGRYLAGAAPEDLARRYGG
jgi:rSAM/selenodomain-associated transferase 2